MSGQGTFVASLFNADGALPVGLKTWNGSDPTRRFNIYRNNVFVSLIDALAETFPVTQALVGSDFFRAMARIYVGSTPPRSRLIFEYGREFPEFVGSFEPAAALAYLADVARLEFLRVEAYNARDATALGAEAFMSLQADPERLSRQHMELHPACYLLRSGHAAYSIWQAHQGVIELESVDPDQAEDVLVCRPVHEVLVIQLPAGGAAFLGSLGQGHTLGEAAESAAGEAGFDLAENFGCLIEHGLVSRLID